MTENSPKAKANQIDESSKYLDHWLGILPGISHLQDAIEKFGPIEEQGKIANASWYIFANNTVRIVILDSETTITTIRITAEFSNQKPLPATLDDAAKIFGQMQVQVNESCTASPVYHCPGVRVGCELIGDPPKVKWIEFY